MENGLQSAHLISVIHKLFQSDEQLLHFFFSHKGPELRISPAGLLEESSELSPGSRLLIQIALDIWCMKGSARVSDMLLHWDNDQWLSFIRAMECLRELGDSP